MIINNHPQLELFPTQELNNPILTSTQLETARSGTFTDNMKLPVHRWFRYSAGFSAEWVKQVIENKTKTNSLNLLDPFAGCGTTLLAAQASKVSCIGFERHPLVHKIAHAKLHWYLDASRLWHTSEKLIELAKKQLKPSQLLVVPLLNKCYTPENLARLEALRNAYFELEPTNESIKEMIWLAITAILRGCSTAGTAQWQYVLPNKKKSKVLEPFVAFQQKIAQMVSDIVYVQKNRWGKQASILLADARQPQFKPQELFDLVITSPPYPNNYDYADATRLEMTFWGEISDWKALQTTVRQYLICSCSQHSAAERMELDKILQDQILQPIKAELSNACQTLAEIRLTKGGKKTYHTMVAAYFQDLANVFYSLRTLCKQNSTVCFVIGDAAPYGVHLPVEKWLGQLAIAAGFKNFSFEKIRDRNMKWKNRKHTVPLHEGRSWIKG
jgi:hypothetical protein